MKGVRKNMGRYGTGIQGNKVKKKKGLRLPIPSSSTNVNGAQVTEQRCGQCNNLFILLVENPGINKELCYNCFVNISPPEAVKHSDRMSAYQRELWQTSLPDNFEEIVKNRTVKHELLMTQEAVDGGDGKVLLDIIMGKILDRMEQFGNIHVSDDEVIKIFNEETKEFENYPEVTPRIKNKMIEIMKKNVLYSTEMHNNHVKSDSTHKDRLLEVVKRQVKPEQYEKLKSILTIWIDEYTKPANEITDEEISSAAEGAIHNLDKHKVYPNGFCERCDEYYNNGKAKIKLQYALDTVREAKELYVKKRAEFYQARPEQTNDAEELKKDCDDFANRLGKQFLNTEQDKVDEFIKGIHNENQKIKDEQKRAREIQKQKLIMKTWKEAKSYILKKNLFTRTDYENFSKTDEFPEDMPITPEQFYSEWKDLEGNPTDKWKEFLGADKRLYDFRKDKKAHTHQTTKVILKEIEKRLDHYWLLTPGLLTSWFKIMGLFHHRDPGIRAFVKQFIEAEKTPEGKRELQIALSKTIFNLQVGHFPQGVDATPLSTKAITYLDRNRTERNNYAKSALLEKTPAISVRSIIENTREVVPMTKDTRWWNLHVEFVKSMIWKQLFDPAREIEEVEAITKEKKNGNAFHDEVLSRFWNEYNGVKSIKTWKLDYNFNIAGVKKSPMLNQLYTAYMIRKMNGFCNFGDPGIGKTNAAAIATRLPHVKFILVIAPFNITKQWETSLKNIYPNSFVSTGKEVFKDWAKGSYDKYYHVINYEKFARDKGNLVAELSNYQIDFVVIDESHHTKIRTDSTISNTRLNIEKLLDKLRISNRKLKCLMLSATPVINNIREGKSLLEMVTGTKYPDLKTSNNLGNATELHSEFVPFSVRYIKNYTEITQEGKDDPIYTDAKIPDDLTKEQIRKLSWRDYEQICTEARIPEIVKRLKKKTIIYTDYVDGDPVLGLPILEQLKNAVEKAGYSVGFFTGGEVKPGIGGKRGLEDWSNCKVVNGKKIPFNPFVNGNLDVLIASSSLSEGINELQYVCNNLILNGLVWTYAEFKQLIGRLVRQGQKSKTVTISIILSKINGYEYDEKVKLNRLELKKMLGNCVTDGTIPNMDKMTNTKKELKKMIEHILKRHESTIKIPLKEIRHD